MISRIALTQSNRRGFYNGFSGGISRWGLRRFRLTGDRIRPFYRDRGGIQMALANVDPKLPHRLQRHLQEH